MTHGEYETNKVEVEMRENVATLIEAMKFVAKHAQEKA